MLLEKARDKLEGGEDSDRGHFVKRSALARGNYVTRLVEQVKED